MATHPNRPLFSFAVALLVLLNSIALFVGWVASNPGRSLPWREFWSSLFLIPTPYAPSDIWFLALPNLLASLAYAIGILVGTRLLANRDGPQVVR
jgi:hypothetical protein